MSTNSMSNIKTNPINIFLVGNNPIELSSIYEKLKAFKNNAYHTEIGFDLKDVSRRILSLNPRCILIDDNLGKSYITKLMRKLSSANKTKYIPVTIIKNSNYHEAYAAAQDFILKETITGESLSHTITNAIRWGKIQWKKRVK